MTDLAPAKCGGGHYDPPITADDRELATYAAKRRYRQHRADGHRTNWILRANRPGWYYDRIGNLGEIGAAKTVGVQIQPEHYCPNGDPGYDFRYPAPPRHGYPIDVKTGAYQGPNPYLKVPVGRIIPEVIYWAAQYLAASDSIRLHGWQWGYVLIQRPVRQFGTAEPTPCYTMPYDELLPIVDLIRLGRER